MSNKDIANLKAIQESITKVFSFIQGINNPEEFFIDTKTFDAVLMNFINIGEAVVRLDTKIIDSNSVVPWNKIKAFRNILVHNYFGVDAEEVWQIIHNDLSDLLNNVGRIIRTHES